MKAININLSTAIFFVVLSVGSIEKIAAQAAPTEHSKADSVVAKALKILGGDKYMGVRSQVGRGKFSVIKDGAVVSFQTFTDAIIYPGTERTDFRSGSSRTVQVNRGDSGWIYDGDQELIKTQTPVQVENFKRGIRTSLDNLLRGYWKGSAELSYVGRRPGTLGTRNDVLRLTYNDGFAIEFEFADDGTPQKAVYKSQEEGADPIPEEDRYAQFIDVDGIKAPFIVDRFTGGAHVSRINYESIEINKSLPDAVFAKPASAKEAKKGIKF